MTLSFRRLAPVAALLVSLLSAAHADTWYSTNYYNSPTHGGNAYLTNALSWTNSAGSYGAPSNIDTVRLESIRWPYRYHTYLSDTQAWELAELRVEAASGNQHQIYAMTEGADSAVIRVINWIGTDSWFGAPHNRYYSLTWSQTRGTPHHLYLEEFNDLGPTPAHLYWGNGRAHWHFTNDAQITYHTTNEYALAPYVDFMSATSVHLRRSPTNLPAVTSETIMNTRFHYDAPFKFGRPDNAVQNWTVDPGSHPVLKAMVGSNSSGIEKHGTNDVNMADVDLFFDLNYTHVSAFRGAGISYASGQAVGPLYEGTVRANSLTIYDRAQEPYRFAVTGRLQLDGEAGLDSGGSGNGRALSVEAYTNDVWFRFGTYFTSGKMDWGQLEITPSGGDVYLGTTGDAQIEFNVNGAEHKDWPTIIANTIRLASTNVFLTDRYRWPQYNVVRTLLPYVDTWNTDARAGGTIEWRDDFVTRSVRTNDFRLDSSTLRVLGGQTFEDTSSFEAASLDMGAVDPSTNNFMVGAFVLGQDSQSNTTARALVNLADTYDNHAGDANTEAVYVEALKMYGGSMLSLNGIKLYVKNSGSWQQATPGGFTYGDGSGMIWDTWPAEGTVVVIE